MKSHDDNALEKRIGFAVRSGNVVFGKTGIRQGVDRGRVRLIIVSEEAASSTNQYCKRLHERTGCPLIRFTGRRPLCDVVGRTQCHCLGITEAQFARSIEHAFRQKKSSGPAY